MLKSIRIERFKSIRELELDLGLVNLFIGGNGSGKSNLLEAIGIMSSSLSRGLSDGDLSRKGVRITPAALMKSAFKNLSLPKSLSIHAEMSSGTRYYCTLTASEGDATLAFSHESCEVGSDRIFGRSPNGASAMGAQLSRSIDRYRGVWDQTRAVIDYPAAVAEELDQVASYAIYAPQTEFLRGIKIGKMETPPIGLHGEGLPTALRGLLSQRTTIRRRRDYASSADYQLIEKALQLVWEPNWAENVHVGKLSELLKSRDIVDSGEDMVYFIDRFMHAKRNKLSVYDSSEGTLFLLFAAILLAHSESPRIFALDNVDSALNPRLTKTLLETIIHCARFRRERSIARGPEQVFLTSHNPTSLDAFDIFDDDARMFVVARNDSGETKVERLLPADGISREEWRIVKRNRNLSQLWIDGEIRGALGGSI